MHGEIQVEGLGRRFGTFEAVKSLTFSVGQGELFGFLGPNGAGKSTTIKMLVTLLRPTMGRALLNGFDVVRQPDQVRRSIGVIFQDPSLDERLTALENMELHAAIYGVPRHERADRIHQLLSMVDLWERRHQAVKVFSGGMKRRLEIARGLLHRPAILFLDEPTVGLDPQSRHRIWEYIAAMRERSRITIFMSTHYMEEAERCDRVGIIDGGRLIALDSPEALRRGVGGDVITLRCDDPPAAAQRLREYGRLPLGEVRVQEEEGVLEVEVDDGGAFVPLLVQILGDGVRRVETRRTTLEDVFLRLTGRGLRDEEASWVEAARTRFRASGRR